MFVPDLLHKITKRAYLLLAAVAVLGAVPLGVLGVLEKHTNSSVAYLFCASVLLSMVLGPCNAVTANVVAPNRRAAAFATFIFFIHLLGDISSPILLGISQSCLENRTSWPHRSASFLRPSAPPRSRTPT